MEMKRILAVGVILLFIGVAVAPSINFSVAIASSDDDLVEVTTQACGIKGYGNNTVKLTREQYQNLESYLVEFRARLNQTSTREEAIPIFKDAVVELDRYGLLLKGMSVERAQRLITTFGKSINLLNRLPSSQDLFKCANLFCLIAGKADISLVANSLLTGFELFLILLVNLSDVYPSDFILAFIVIQTIFLLYKNTPPNRIGTIFNILSVLTFGAQYTYYTKGADGWIFTIGLLGIRTSNSPLYGQIPIPVFAGISGYLSTHYTGALGFTGFRIFLPDDSSLFFGTALRVNIDDSPPSYPIMNQ
jgi:hypothetical protein